MKKNLKIAIVVSRFNEKITESLLDCCAIELIHRGVHKSAINVVRVPGAYELPYAVHKLAKSKKYSAVIGLGCVIKGDTSHDQHVAGWAATGIGLASLFTDVPCLFGVLTPNNESQAWKRSKPGPLNRGKEIAQAAMEMIELKNKGTI